MVFHILKNVFYFVICSASVMSNTMLITILLRLEHLRTTSNIFILNLALCDVTTVLLSIPFAVAIEESSSYPFGIVGCKVLMPAATAGINSAALTLLLIAVERFYAIIYPMRARMQSCQTKVIVLCVLHGLSIASVIPFGIHQRYTQKNQTNICLEKWPPNGEQAYTLFLFSIQYVIPLTLIVILYSISWNAIRKQNKVIINMQRLQQNGCHYSRSQSWDLNMRKSETSKSLLEGTGEDSQLIKQSSSAYSFKSTQLEVVDEVDMDAKDRLFEADEQSVKESHSDYSFRSGQLEAVKEDNDYDDKNDNGCDDGDDVIGDKIDPDSLVIDSKADEYSNGGKIDDVNQIQIESDETRLETEVEQDDAEQKLNHIKATQAKHPKSKKLSVFSKFKPFQSKNVPQSQKEFGLQEHSVVLVNKSHENGVINVQPKSSLFNMKRRSSKAFISDKDVGVNHNQVSQSLTEQSSEPALSVEEPSLCRTKCFSHRKGIPQSSSSCALIGYKHESAGSKIDRIGLIDGRQMTQSASSPILAGSDSHTQPKKAVKIPTSEPEIASSKFSLLASTARRRFTNAFRSSSNENLSLASVKRMKQTRRTLVMFTCVVIVFAICMLPNQITWIWVAFQKEHLDHVITTIFYFLTYTNSILNPWIYGAVNPNFRKAYKKVFLCDKRSIPGELSRQGNGSKVSHSWLSRKSSDQNSNQNDGMSRFESLELKRGALSVSHSRSFQK